MLTNDQRTIIDAAITEYDLRKSPRRKVFGDHAAIASLKALMKQDNSEITVNDVFACFERNKLKPNKASTAAFQTLLMRLFTVDVASACINTDLLDEAIKIQIANIAASTATCLQHGFSTHIHTDKKSGHINVNFSVSPYSRENLVPAEPLYSLSLQAKLGYYKGSMFSVKFRQPLTNNDSLAPVNVNKLPVTNTTCRS